MVEKQARLTYKEFIDSLIERIKYASSTSVSEVFISAVQNGIRMTMNIEEFLSDGDDYRSSFLKEETQRESELIKRMKGLESLAKEGNLEAAKLRAEFFVAELENMKDQILK